MALLFHHHHLLLLLLLFHLITFESEALRERVDTPPTEPCCSTSSSRIASIIALVFLASITGILWYIGICRRRNIAVDAAFNADGPAKPGLEKSMIDSFTIMLYSEVKELRVGKGTVDCAVCLCEFEEGDALRLLPVCSHAFHPCCIDTWLLSNTTCPVCRTSLTNGQLTRDVTGDVEENRPETSRGEMDRNEWTEEERERFALRLPETLRMEMVGRSLERSEMMGCSPATGAWNGRTTGGFVLNGRRKELEAKSDRYVNVPVGPTWLPSPECGGSAAALDGGPVEEALAVDGNRC